MNKFFGLMLALMLACVMPTHAQHSQNPDADYMQINVWGWLFCPATDSSEVKGFLTFLDGRDSAGLNIQLVWYQREADGSWTAWGWKDRDLGGAVWWVRSHLNDPLAFTPDIDLDEAAERVGPEAATPPRPLVNGMFADDPSRAVVEQVESAPLVVDAQLCPTPHTPATATPCGQLSLDALQHLLDDLASDVEVAYFGSAPGGRSIGPKQSARAFSVVVPLLANASHALASLLLEPVPPRVVLRWAHASSSLGQVAVGLGPG